MQDYPAIALNNVGKAYGRTWAISNLNLQIQTGERIALLGPNGAGKTTLIRVLATLTALTRGSVYLCGVSTGQHKRDARRLVGVVGHKPYLYEDMSARENLEFFARLYGIVAPARVYQPLIEQAGLSRAIDLRVSAFSRGMQQRLSLVRALLHDPKVLLLDEPDTGLDQEALRFLESVVLSHTFGTNETRTVVFSTHNLETGMRLASRIIMLVSGRVVYDEPVGIIDMAAFRSRYEVLAGSRV